MAGQERHKMRKSNGPGRVRYSKLSVRCSKFIFPSPRRGPIINFQWPTSNFQIAFGHWLLVIGYSASPPRSLFCPLITLIHTNYFTLLHSLLSAISGTEWIVCRVAFGRSLRNNSQTQVSLRAERSNLPGHAATFNFFIRHSFSDGGRHFFYFVTG